MYSLSIRVHTTKNHISIYFLPQYQRQRKCFFFQSASWKRHCVTHWREQLGRDSYLPRQISQSDCEISSNCGKKANCLLYQTTIKRNCLIIRIRNSGKLHVQQTEPLKNLNKETYLSTYFTYLQLITRQVLEIIMMFALKIKRKQPFWTSLCVSLLR